MEDVIIEVPDLEDYCQRSWGEPGVVKAFFGVFDGHAGIGAAEFCRDTLLRCITQHEAFPEDIAFCMREGFLQTERLFFQAVAGDDVSDSGTTALVVLVWGETLYVANLGDSRAVLCCGGKTMQVTRDHRPTCDLEHARITRAGGSVSSDHRLNGCLSVSRAIGDFFEKGVLSIDGPLLTAAEVEEALSTGALIAEPELHVHKLTASDEFLVLACDGLWDKFSNERVIELARDSLKELNDPQACAKELVDQAKLQYATDNLSAIALCFSSEAPRKRMFSFKRSLSTDAISKLQGAFADLTDNQLQTTAEAAKVTSTTNN